MVGQEIFCSYAHSDNDAGWVDEFCALLAKTFQKLTGERPSVFLDRESMMTSDLWESRIRTALQGSQVLVAVVSPSYVRSEWCRREWVDFSRREEDFRTAERLTDDRGLIFPILLYPLQRGRFDAAEREFAAAIAERQWLDVTSQVDRTPIRHDQVRQLAEQIIDTVIEMETSRRHVYAAEASIAAGTTIRDPSSGLEWTASLSPTELTVDEARRYVADLHVAGNSDWRLPTRADLETLIDPTLIDEAPDADPFPFRDPFGQRFGYLQSGTPVSTSPGAGHFVMNARNGHIFNGLGYRCWVRAVRDLD